MGHVLSGLPAPACYGPVDWDSQTNQVMAYADALGPLNPLEQMEQEIALAMHRAGRMVPAS